MEHWSRLMVRAQAGERAAYRRLLTEVTPFLRRVIARRIASADICEDILQEALISIHQARHTYDPERPIRPWLAAIARRRSFDYLRGLHRGERLSLALAAVANVAEQGPDGEPLGVRSLQRDELHAEIAKLPMRQRQALQYLKLEEMSLKEAAAATGQSVGALKVAVHRGIASLRARLKEADHDG